MNFDIKEAVEILERTPVTLEHMLSGLSEATPPLDTAGGKHPGSLAAYKKPMIRIRLR